MPSVYCGLSARGCARGCGGGHVPGATDVVVDAVEVLVVVEARAAVVVGVAA
jgi:hypothetical protein